MCKFIECNLAKKGKERVSTQNINVTDGLMKELDLDIAADEIYCIEKVNSMKFVHFIIKYGQEESKSFAFDRYGPSGKLHWVKKEIEKAVS